MALRTNLDSIPPTVQEYKLPSGGVTYRDKYPKFPATIKVKPFSFAVEAILNTNLHFHEKYRRIVEQVAEFPAGFELNDLLQADQMVILALARGLTYGDTYEFTTVCTACNTAELHTMKVPEELPVRNWSFKDQKELEKHCTVELPCKDKLLLRMMTLADFTPKVELKASESSAKLVRGGSLAALPEDGVDYLRDIARQIVSVNHTTADSEAEMMQYLLRLPGPDKEVLKDFRRDFQCGIDYNLKIACNDCGAVYQSALPIASSFFRRG